MLTAAVLALALVPPPEGKAVGATAPTVKGALTIDGKAILLTHGFAAAQEGAFDRTREDTVVVFTDAALSPADEKDEFARYRRAAEGKLNLVEVTIDGEGKVISSQFLTSGQQASISGIHEFTGKPPDGRRAAGKLASTRPFEIGSHRVTYEVTFDLPIRPRPPAPTEASTAGLAASEHGKLVTAYFDAIRAGDRAKLKAMVMPELAGQLDGPDAADLLEMLKAMAPAAPLRFTSIEVEGDTATVVISEQQEGSTSTSKVKLVKTPRGWLVGR